MEIIFYTLCGLLYLVGLPFGWNYLETSVYICMGLWPWLCLLSTLPIAIGLIARVVKGPGRLWALLLLPATAVYSYIYWLYVKCFTTWNMSMSEEFYRCQNTLMEIAKNLGSTYAIINLLIYIFLFAAIVWFNYCVARIAFPSRKIVVAQ